MQAQVKYESEVKTAVPQEQDKRNREVERRLFDVFRKYAGRG